MGPFVQEIQLILSVIGAVAAVLAIVKLYCQVCSKINALQGQVGALEIDYQKTFISIEQKIAELQRAKAVLIKKAQHDSKRFHTIENRLHILETQLPHRTSAVGRTN